MTALDEFLSARDLDDLLNASVRIISVSADEVKRLETIIRKWSDRQAVANLLFHPRILPEHIRRKAVDRALRARDDSYLPLAAVVGLSQIKPEGIPDNQRQEWMQIVLDMIRSDSSILSERASVTIASWVDESNIGMVLKLFPVPSSTASRNILALALLRFGELSRDEFKKRVAACGVSDEAIEDFEDYHAEYRIRKSIREPGTDWMKCPLYAYIPNLTEEPVAKAPVENIKRKPQWWKIWSR